MRRRMLFFERLMYVDGRTPVNCVMTARIRGSLSQDELRFALDKVQARHPLLRVSVDEADPHPDFVFRAEPHKIPLRLVTRMTDEDWRAESAVEWKTPFKMDREPLIRLVWIRSEDISELLLVGHHCVCDGASLVTIFRELLQVVDQPDLALTAYPPFESLRDLVPESVFRDRKMALSVLLKSAVFKLFALTVRTASPNREDDHYLIYWRADAEASSALTLRSKAEGCSPFAAMCVAFLKAFQQVEETQFKNKLMCPINIRRFIPHLDADVMFNYAPAIPLALSRRAPSDFWSQARTLKQSMATKIRRLNAYEQLIAAEHLHSSLPKLVSLLLRSRGSYDFAFSNVGRVDMASTYRKFQVERLLGVTVALPWRNATTLVTTQFCGHTDVAFISRKEFLPYSKAVAIKEKAIEILAGAISSIETRSAISARARSESALGL